MVTPDHHIKPDDVAAPIDIRLLPAAALTAIVCLTLPTASMAWVRWLPVVLPILGGVAVLGVALARKASKRRVVNVTLIVAIACWLATPAAFFVQQQRIAAEDSGWLEFVDELGTANISAQLVTAPVKREGPFVPSWYATADVEHYGKDLTATDHPAKIVISGDETWQELTAGTDVCFMGRVSDNESSVFVQAITGAEPGTCFGPDDEHNSTGRDVLRETLRNQSADTLSYAPQLLPGLILGDRSQQTEDVEDAMNVSGLSHLSAVSGAHTSLIAAAATLLFRTLRLPRGVVIAAFMCTLLLFVQIVGMQPSIIRAATMGAIGAWALFFGRGSQALPILALSTIVLLTISPELIHEVGFQLSVAATAGIVLGAQPLDRWLHGFLEKLLPDFWASLLSSSLAVSATAQLACQPILLTFIDYVSPYSLVANLFATPLLPLIMIPGTIAAAICVVAPWLSQVLLHIVSLPAAGIGWIATTAAELPGATLPWPQGPAGTALVVLHWAASLIFVLKLLRFQRRPKPPVKIATATSVWNRVLVASKEHYSFANVFQYAVLAIALVAHVAVFWPVQPSSINTDWDIVGCDVGQGDMYLVRTGPTSAMVIDTGPDGDLATQCLAEANIEQIDVMVITHLHADHVGGVSAVLEEYQPDQILYSTGTDPAHDAESTGIPPEARLVSEPLTGIIDHANEDDDHPVEVRWNVLAANTQASNENNASIVMLVEIYRHGGVVEALYTGDLEEDEATKLIAEGNIPEDIDILKLSHHGAQNGGVEIIEHTAPNMALVGVGEDNTYGHPHDDILDALGPRVAIRRTDVDGTFAVTFEQNQAYVALDR
ncbi:ComEC/Rec2 family competence protein [Yaniella flava]|uniref:ComEC/Rec2 family competence protein n=1 Tax=Yaniella flava TaxID=287930 RepID=A0ABP5FX23_9MICC